MRAGLTVRSLKKTPLFCRESATDHEQKRVMMIYVDDVDTDDNNDYADVNDTKRGYFPVFS